MIEHPTGTLCRCGVSLDLCADCRGWLELHSMRIRLVWGVRLDAWGAQKPGQVWVRTQSAERADFREGLYLASYKLLRQ